MKRLHYLIIVLFLICSLSLLVYSAKAAHFGGVTPTRSMVDFIGYITIDGQAVMAGDEIGVFDDKDFLVGICEITAEGQYGVIHVYGDDPETEEPDGANTDSMLTFKVWLADSKTEIEVTEDMMSTQILGSFGESSIPPQWTADLEKYVLNINIDTSQQHALGQQGDTGGGCFISCLRNFKYP